VAARHGAALLESVTAAQGRNRQRGQECRIGDEGAVSLAPPPSAQKWDREGSSSMRSEMGAHVPMPIIRLALERTIWVWRMRIRLPP
jgi:hypothetical protein